MSEIYIVAAKRTPQGRFMGALSKYSAVDMAIMAGKAILEKVQPEQVDQVIVGNVLAAGQGMNTARQIAVKLGIPVDSTAFTVNMMCASGMQAVILAAQAIKLGRANTVLCGGTESMSSAPYLLDRARFGYKLGDGVLIDSLLSDGLVDSFDKEHMGFTAERIAQQYQINRRMQDEFAIRSHRNYAEAQAKGKFNDERIVLKELEQDEHPRPDTTIDKLGSLKPTFRNDGTITAGNASGINDGAAMLIVCDQKTAKKNGWKPLAKICDWAAIGCDHRMMGLGPVYATQKICRQQNLKIDDFDTIEINEAFAAQAIVCMQQLQIDIDRLNLEGGAIALGHPIGTSGARLLVHLSHRINRGESSKALATLCVGGGMGVAMALEKTI
ncbi:MAG: acetyl-CoA C-acetyltransferase [Planctomycetota bacterium]